jgi:hypothetical protein
MTPTDQQLQLALARMLPEMLMVDLEPIDESAQSSQVCGIKWRSGNSYCDYVDVRETEWLHVCWLVEQGADRQNFALAYQQELERIAAHNRTDKRGRWAVYHASWQQRATALAKVKGVNL